MQPLVYTDDGGIKGCGLRLLVTSQAPQVFAEIADFSVNFFTGGGGMLKLSLVTVRESKTPPDQWRKVAPTDFTVMAEDGSAMPKSLKFAKSPSDPASLMVISFEDAVELYGKLLQGDRMHLRVKRQGSDRQTVYAFSPAFDDAADRKSALACVSGASKRVQPSTTPGR